MRHQYTGQLGVLVSKGISGKSADVDFIMSKLDINATLAMTRFADFALSLVETEEGINRITDYLFRGTLIQRNYASLFLNRIGEWEPVVEAYKKGLIDEIQAFSR